MVKKAEWPRLGYFFCLFLVISAGLAIGRGTADALFLKRFGIQYLPYMYLGLGVLMATVSTVYAAYADRLAPERTFKILLGALAVMLVGNWYLMLSNLDTVAYPLYYLLFEISSELLVMHASLYFSANFDNEQSKRLLPMTMAGLQLGEVAGGLDQLWVIEAGQRLDRGVAAFPQDGAGLAVRGVEDLHRGWRSRALPEGVRHRQHHERRALQQGD